MALNMKDNWQTWLLGIFAAALLGFGAWIGVSLTSLKTEVAVLQVKIDSKTPNEREQEAIIKWRDDLEKRIISLEIAVASRDNTRTWNQIATPRK